MKFRALIFFCSGVFFTTVIAGMTQLVGASTDNVITVCVNNKTGVMRYLTKGSCKKKTETRLSWNSVGVTGAPGAKGEAGIQGASGRNGKNFHVIDSVGRDLGVALGVGFAGNEATVQFEGGLWNVANYSSAPHGAISFPAYYTDPSCINPLWYAPASRNSTPAARGSTNRLGSEYVFVKPVGLPFSGTTLNAVYMKEGPVVNGQKTCVTIDPRNYVDEYFTNVEIATPPPFTAPFTLVEK